MQRVSSISEASAVPSVRARDFLTGRCAGGVYMAYSVRVGQCQMNCEDQVHRNSEISGPWKVNYNDLIRKSSNLNHQFRRRCDVQAVDLATRYVTGPPPAAPHTGARGARRRCKEHRNRFQLARLPRFARVMHRAR